MSARVSLRGRVVSSAIAGVFVALGVASSLIRADTALHQAAMPSPSVVETAGAATASASAAAAAAPQASSASATGLNDGTYDGAAITTRYGTVQVQIVVSGGVVDSVNALSLPNRDGKSRNISSRAAPILQAEVVAAQSAQIANVSGATYTSNGYAQSLQAALDAARA